MLIPYGSSGWPEITRKWVSDHVMMKIINRSFFVSSSGWDRRSFRASPSTAVSGVCSLVYAERVIVGEHSRLPSNTRPLRLQLQCKRAKEKKESAVPKCVYIHAYMLQHTFFFFTARCLACCSRHIAPSLSLSHCVFHATW